MRSRNPAAAASARGGLALAAFAGALLLTGTAVASPAGGADGAGLHEYEAEVLGPDHAAEHALARRAQREERERWAAMSPAERAAAETEQREADAAEAIELAAAGPPSEIGEWTSAPFPIPNFAIHSAVLPTGKVLFWGYPPKEAGVRANTGQAALWNPGEGTAPQAFTNVPPPAMDPDGPGGPQVSGPAPIYCSGQSLLPSGALLATGGNLVWPESNGYTKFAGTPTAYTFNPWTETWTRQPDMRGGRWYPSQTVLGDGRTLVTSGYDETAPGAVVNEEVEVFNAPSALSGQGSFDYTGLANERRMALYPHLFLMPDGDVLLAGPNKHDSPDAAILDTADFTWEQLPLAREDRAGSGAALLPGGPGGSSRVIQTGGFDYKVETTEEPKYWPAHRSSEVIDGGAASPTWSDGPEFNHGRSNHNLVLLPDGSMVAVGGGRGSNRTEGGYMVHNDGRLKQVEIYDPATGQWRLGPAQQEDRAYHSTAVLLPDGRVMSAGDDMNPKEGGDYSTSDTAEIYSPPYLYKGTRPQIGSAPESVRWGDSFGIASPSSAISRAVLMAPPATTHGVDMHQRHVELRVSSRLAGQGVNVVAPPGSNVAPPGYYMLFLLNSNNVPSVAQWVKLDPAAPDRPDLTTAAVPPAPGAGPNVEVTPVSRRKALREKGKVVLRLEADEAASVKLAVALQPRATSSVVAERTKDVVLAPGARKVVVKFPRSARKRFGRRSLLVVGIDASDQSGSRTAWSRAMRLRR